MDLKDDEKSIKFREHPNISSRYFESSAGHLFVNNVNPFNGAGGFGGEAKEHHTNKRKNDEFIDVFDATTKDSKALIEEIMNNYRSNRNVYLKDPYDDEINEAFLSENQRPIRPYSQPAMSSHTSPFDTQYITTCSKNAPKPSRYTNQVRFDEFNEDDNRHKRFTSSDVETDPFIEASGRAEKTTYCRPMTNMYNQEFVYKTMQRNARLQRLVRKLVIARETEKQRETWNNYINDLKNKHRYYSNEPSTISPQYVPDEPNAEVIDDFYNTRYDWRQSNPCQHLLQDFYGAHNHMPPNPFDSFPRDDYRSAPGLRPHIYDNERHCYPTSSQSNLLHWNKIRRGNNFASDWHPRPAGRYYRGHNIIVEKEPRYMDAAFDRIQGTTRYRTRSVQPGRPCKCKRKMLPVIRSASIPIQTEKSLPEVSEEEDKEEAAGSAHKPDSFKDKFKRVTSNIAKLKNKMRQCDDESKVKSLAHIEEKIDTLIKSINTIMVDMKSKKGFRHKSSSVACRFTTSHNNLSRPKSDPYGLLKNKEYVCGVVQESSRNLTLSEVGPSGIQKNRESSISKMDKIILEEMKKSDKVKRDIEELLNLRTDRNCAVHITFDIPTRERATEVTDSLSKARLEADGEVVVEEITCDDPSEEEDTQMTIAVNTDPLGLFALLRVSTETIKQLLSYMPNLNYNSYLSMLQLPTKTCVSHYICNICGASFGRPSQLSDHIHKHNLGRTRDCCVCRHSLDSKRTREGLFACRYCGQRFTRAYCCELHQQTCAKRLGRRHDVSSSHVLLR